MFQRADELADPLVELPDQKAVERDAVLEQPEEGATVHQRQPCIAQRHHIVTARLALEHGALPEPGPRGHAGQSHGLAAARHGTHSGKTRDNAGPVVEGISTHENIFVGTIGFLHDAGAGDLNFPFVQFARPGRDALEVIRSNHDRIDRRVLIDSRAALQQKRNLAKISRPIVSQKTFQTIAFP